MNHAEENVKPDLVLYPNKRILVVEDMKVNLLLMKKLLSKHEVTVDAAGNGVEAVEMLKKFSYDLVFMDIELADGQSFSILEQVDIGAPLIFTTAYDQYALKAFRVNGIDYLLKPIEQSELERAIGKFKLYARADQQPDYSRLLDMIRNEGSAPTYKERFMIKVGDQLKFVPATDIAYFFSDAGATSLVTGDGREFIIDYTLDQLKDLLDPASYFRINRKVMVSISAIQKIHSWFNSRLKLELNPLPQFDVVVARERVPEFKIWLDR